MTFYILGLPKILRSYWSDRTKESFSLVDVIYISNLNLLISLFCTNSCSWLQFTFLPFASRLILSKVNICKVFEIKCKLLEIIDQSLRSGLNINEAINIQKREYLLPQRRVELWKFCFCLKVNICWRISLV